MDSLRTPDDRFTGLDGYPFTPNYVEVDDFEGGSLRVHYLDEGPHGGPVALLMHGEPSWSYLYRHMIPRLNERGVRCIAPDLVGFGRSDKPRDRSDYTYARHVAWMGAVVFGHLDLRAVTMFCQDWGGLIGLRLVAEQTDRFAAVVVSNTGLPTGEHNPPAAFLEWLEFSQTVEDFDVGALLQMATTSTLPESVLRAYDAPFPDDSYKAGARIFPALVPITPDDPGGIANREAWVNLAAFEGPFRTCFGADDAVTRGGHKPFEKLIAGAQGQPHEILAGGNHFIQEDLPDALVGHILEVMPGG